MELNQILLVLGGIPMITWLFSTLLFTRTSMKYIDRKLLANDKGKLAWDNGGWGYHISSLIALVARGKTAKYSVLDDKEILKHIRTYDRILAKISCYSFYITILIAAINYYINEL